MATMNFRINPDNYLGLQHDKFKNDMMQIALTNPTKYYALRNAVMQNTVRTVVSDMYNKIYLLLTVGKLSDREADASAALDGGVEIADATAKFIPNMSEKEVSDFAMSVATTVRSMLIQAITKLLPDDYINLASARLASQASTRNINTAL
jgi:hypothetical protein